ncbi:S-layer homology domain-containing protein [Bacillus cereus]|uniref:S-layer homology domain-containing protein n=1 Tax=Bacillus cereus TaxID=1396 RepID=UPI002AC1A20A|nr:S-layer homology domain-containing protein [Bacillus cereus]MDZ4417373.1 S-layer homology domain-containing protein [Bacillus cereus]
MKKELIATGILTGTLLLQTSAGFAATQKFQDVPNWARQSVNYLVDKQVFIGMQDNVFGSNETLDRASAATILTRALGLQIDQNAKPSFTDSQSHWGTPYIAAAEKAGIIKGEGNGMFNPSGKVTRATMAAMLVNAYNLQGVSKENKQSKFEDLQGHWSEKFANTLINLKVSAGTNYGWEPNKMITRAEAAQLIAKSDIISNDKKNKLKKSDIVNSNNEMNLHVQKNKALSNISSTNNSTEKLQQQNLLEQQLKNLHFNKKSGKVIEKKVNSLLVEGENSKISVSISPEFLKTLSLGDTVNVYAQSYASTMMLGSPIIAVSPIIQKNGEAINLEQRFKKKSGKVIEKTANSLLVEGENSKVSVNISPEFLKTVSPGDTVNVYAQSYASTMMPGSPIVAVSPIIQK